MVPVLQPDSLWSSASFSLASSGELLTDTVFRALLQIMKSEFSARGTKPVVLIISQYLCVQSSAHTAWYFSYIAIKLKEEKNFMQV